MRPCIHVSFVAPIGGSPTAAAAPNQLLSSAVSASWMLVQYSGTFFCIIVVAVVVPKSEPVLLLLTLCLIIVGRYVHSILHSIAFLFSSRRPGCAMVGIRLAKNGDGVSCGC